MGNNIVADSASLSDLESVLSDSSECYFKKISALEESIGEITTGPLKGTLANEIKTKFEEKKEAFAEVGKAISAARDGASAKSKEFEKMIADVKSSMG